MRIALIGYGKMGKMIEETAIQRGHEIVLRIDIENADDFNEKSAAFVDVAIEFTAPPSAYGNVVKCLQWGVPVVSGTTGWYEQLPLAKQYCLEKGGAFLHTSNFSIGVNIFFELNALLARLMAAQPDYDVQLKEIHHTQKKDSPSGTAVTLAEQILAELTRKNGWANKPSQQPENLVIISERIDPAPGTHHVKYTSAVDDIEIIHTAHSRKGFALGAVMAAEYIYGKKGIFSMKEVLGLPSTE